MGLRFYRVLVKIKGHQYRTVKVAFPVWFMRSKVNAVAIRCNNTGERLLAFKGELNAIGN
jgi:hypothetical protein